MVALQGLTVCCRRGCVAVSGRLGDGARQAKSPGAVPGAEHGRVEGAVCGAEHGAYCKGTGSSAAHAGRTHRALSAAEGSGAGVAAAAAVAAKALRREQQQWAAWMWASAGSGGGQRRPLVKQWVGPKIACVRCGRRQSVYSAIIWLKLV